MDSLNEIAMLSYIITIVLFLTTSLGMSFKGWLDWRIYGLKNYKGIKGRVFFIVGIVGFILSIIGIFIYFSNYEIDSKDETISIDTNEVGKLNPISPTSNFYKSNYSYENSTYTGYMNPETMIPNGEGTMVYTNNDEYCGNWVEGVKSGFGIMRYHNGDVYEGEWKNDKKHGEKSLYTWKDNKRYEGSYDNDQRHGYGEFYGWFDLSNGWEGTYKGDIVDGNFEGQGTFEFVNGDIFIGEFRDNKRWNGTYYSENGLQYEIVNGEPRTN
ncbi:MAG: hypothetical protein FWC09_04475 [Lachnospiraceae bacterium]|nr:hypothetical protein [Lachnospiraceae bacterium]